MNWFYEPENWKIENGTLTMDVSTKSDYLRISHYEFTVDDAPLLSGVTIGDDTLSGSGSVLTKDIPAGVAAAGNPCKVIRKITEKTKWVLQRKNNS